MSEILHANHELTITYLLTKTSFKTLHNLDNGDHTFYFSSLVWRTVLSDFLPSQVCSASNFYNVKDHGENYVRLDVDFSRK
jgi:hypothetical protein